jgi:hypothetical protein
MTSNMKTLKLSSKCLIQRALAFVLVFLCSSMLLQAQNVTVSQVTGNMIPSMTEYSSGTETGWAAGAFATWRHNQLPLTMTASDGTELTEDGLLSVHANNFYPMPGDTKALVMVGGQSHDGTMTLSLPKGYRFTSYKFILVNNVTSIGSGTDQLDISTTSNFYFGETNSSFAYSSYKDLGTCDAANTKEYTLERTSTTTGDMGNILYFKLSNGITEHGAIEYMSVQMKYIELTFTAEAPFTASLAPTSASQSFTSYVEMPFLTGKTDLGKISQNTYQGATRESYYYNNVTDMPASALLYEAACVSENAGSVGSLDGNKTIAAVSVGGNYYYTVKSGNTYYIESPVTAVDQGGNEVPVHYRITGAALHYTAGTTTLGLENGFNITYTANGTTYYLNSSLIFAAGAANQTVWYQDDSDHLYYLSNGVKTYITYDKNISFSLTTDVNNAKTFTYSNGNLSFVSKNKTRYLTASGTTGGKLTSNTTGTRASVQSKSYKIIPFAKWGNELTDEAITVTGTGTYQWTGLNNDAIGFRVESVDGSDAYGFITADLTMEALDPYINHMEVVCHTDGGGKTDLKIMREFTANDFSVGGGTFYFSVPGDYIGTECRFTFENLKSNYGDNTYYDNSGTGNARYSFVKSVYYDLFASGTDNNIYSNVEAASDHTYTDKVYVEKAGTKAFTFNNAADINGTTTSTYLKEYPFSLTAYGTEGGAFSDVKLTPIENEESDTHAYVFTTDETRYNIAPTYATQHRYYAYYDMHIYLNTATYVPTATLTKLYDTSFYGDASTGAFYGATVTADEGKGYSSVADVVTAIQTAKPEDVTLDHILYVDLATQLAGVYQTTGLSWDGLKTQLAAPNLLVFIPAGMTHEDDNFAYAESGGTFKSSRNIIITDKQPFFSPYKIRVDAANYATYTRELSGSNTQARKATLVLPFTLTLTDGHHANRGNACAFDVYTMNATNCLSESPEQTEGYRYNSLAYFSKYTGATTEANKPYMVLVDDAYMPADGTSFIVEQYGSDIMPTPTTADQTTLIGETATGTVDGSTYTLVNHGTYCGEQVAQVFYFANNKYYSSANLATADKKVNVRPFRSYYAYTSGGGAKMATFDIVFGENNNDATGIDAVKSASDLAVTTGNGTITFFARTAQTVRVYASSGLRVASVTLKSGDTRTLTVPSGLYVINGTKIIVK